MASLKFSFTVAVAAFVSYALIGSVACDEEARKFLEYTLMIQTPLYFDVGTLLSAHANKSDEFEGHTVGQLEDLCKETLSNCPVSEFDSSLELSGMYESKSHLQLSAYILNCRLIKLGKYCGDNIIEVGKYLRDKTVSKEDQELVRPFMEFLEDIGALNIRKALRSYVYHPYPEQKVEKEKEVVANIVQAYLKIRQSYYGKEYVNRNEDAEFRTKLSKALKSFEQIYRTIKLYRPHSIGNEIYQDDDILIREIFDLYGIAEKFDSVFSSEEFELQIRDETL